MKNTLDHARRFGAGETETPVHHVGEIRTSQGGVGIQFIVADPRDPEIRHDNLPSPRRAPRRFSFTFVTNYRPVGNSTIAEYSKFFNT
jgi:hypothetical protein